MLNIFQVAATLVCLAGLAMFLALIMTRNVEELDFDDDF